MIKAVFFSFFLVASGFVQSYAQNIDCQLLDANANPVGYANIYVPSILKGTVSDADGLFSVNLTKAKDTDSVIISCIGFDQKICLAGDLRTKIDACDIQLAEAKYMLEEATIRAKPFVETKVLGIPKPSFNIIGNIARDSASTAGSELGNIMKTKRDWALQKIGFYISDITMDSLKVEVNIYNMDNGEIKEPINKKRIFLTLYDDKIDKTPFEIDLQNHQLIGSGNFFVSIEMIDKEDDVYDIMFPAKLFKGLTRYKHAYGSWEKVPVGISLGLWAEVKLASK